MISKEESYSPYLWNGLRLSPLSRIYKGSPGVFAVTPSQGGVAVSFIFPIPVLPAPVLRAGIVNL